MGDGANDLEFLEQAGWGAAMKNGKTGAQEAADVTIPWDNDDHGVMKTLQELEAHGYLDTKSKHMASVPF